MVDTTNDVSAHISAKLSCLLKLSPHKEKLGPAWGGEDGWHTQGPRGVILLAVTDSLQQQCLPLLACDFTRWRCSEGAQGAFGQQDSIQTH